MGDNKMKKQRKKSKGLTLIESLVAIILILIGVLAFLGVPIFVAKLTEERLHKVQAFDLAVEKLNELTTQDYDTITNGNDTVTIGITYTRQWQVEEVIQQNIPFKFITVSVDYTGMRGQKSVTAKGAISRVK